MSWRKSSAKPRRCSAATSRYFTSPTRNRRCSKQKPDSVVVTNERLIINRQGLGGTRLEDYQWKDIMSIQMRDGLMGTTFSLLDRNDHIIQVDDLPKPQLEKLCQLGQEMRADRAVS